MKDLKECMDSFKEALIELQLFNYKKVPITAFTSFEEIDRYIIKHGCNLVFNGDYLEVVYD